MLTAIGLDVAGERGLLSELIRVSLCFITTATICQTKFALYLHFPLHP